jgi:AraC-like DNA-binding protein
MAYHREKLIELATDLLRRQTNLTATEIGERLHVHRHTLRRAPRANGQSVASIKQGLLLGRLERHFAEGRATSLKELWSELGFASASAFARYVRHATGKSPGALRAGFILGHSARERSRMSLDMRKSVE